MTFKPLSYGLLLLAIGILPLAACGQSGTATATRSAPSTAAVTLPTIDPAAPTSKNLAYESTQGGFLAIQPLNHSALRFEFKGKQYYVDPAGTAEWAKLPKADAIFITHPHGDHMSVATINQIKKEGTLIFASAATVQAAGVGTAMNPGDKKIVLDIEVEAIPAYNLTANRLTYHPQDRKDNGYLLTFAEKRVYVAGDTEGIPEMKALKDIDVAFLPINLPYTMTPQDAAAAAKAFKPKIVYPYHQGQSNPADFKTALADEKGIEVRVLALP